MTTNHPLDGELTGEKVPCPNCGRTEYIAWIYGTTNNYETCSDCKHKFSVGNQ